MQTLSPATTAVEITIKGSQYTVEAIDAGEFGISAVRVLKMVNGESYDLLRTADNRLECTCPDFVCRHSDKGSCCKHLAYAVANGLLPASPAPISGGSPVADVPPAPVPAAVAPITRADQARAKMWGLRLPAAPLVEETPTPIAVEAPGLASDDEAACPLPEPDHTAPSLPGPVVTPTAPMAWVKIGPNAYVEMNVTPTRTDYSARNAELDRRARRRGGFVPTLEEEQEAALILADRRGSCLAGESGPRIGDRSFPKKPRPWTTTNALTDADIYPHGVC